MAEIGKEPYKGVRDFYPEDMAIQNYIFGVMRKTAEAFGYEEYGASVLEPAELYKAKSGEELVNEQSYTFTDKGGREVMLRPEMTPTLARMVAGRKKSLVFPLRWYSIPNLFRYERPQRGRVREHWQLNVDIFGVEDLSADIEIIQIAYNVMRNFGVSDEKFEIRINDRALVDQTLKDIGLSGEKAEKMKKLIDKKDKIDNFQEEADKIAGKKFEFDMKPSENIEKAIEMLKNIGITNVIFTPTLMRGLDYYTGIVFEVFDKSPDNNRAMFGGGRYDNLLEIFGEEKIPAVGFGMGDVTMLNILETYNLLPEYAPSIDLYVCTVDKENIPDAQEFANKMREKNLNVLVNTSGKKLSEQVEKAGKKKVKFMVCIGQEEIDSKKYKIKNLKSGEEKEVSENEISDLITS